MRDDAEAKIELLEVRLADAWAHVGAAAVALEAARAETVMWRRRAEDLVEVHRVLNDHEATEVGSCLDTEAANMKLRATLGRVRKMCAHARKISGSGSMAVYVADVEAALGDNVTRPHKLGRNSDGEDR